VKNKILILLLSLTCFTGTSYGQATIPPAPIKGVTPGFTYPVWDTLATVGTTTKNWIISGTKNLVGVQVNVKKISGTVAGWINLNVALDTGATYTTIASVALKDTAFKSYYFQYNYNPGYYYQTTVNTTGTSSVASSVWQLPRN
jgi:hypothetical protein